MATFPPQSALTSVDLPTFGRPATATKPLFMPTRLTALPRSPAALSAAARGPSIRSPHPQRAGEDPLTLCGERSAKTCTRLRQFGADSPSLEIPRLGKQARGRV